MKTKEIIEPQKIHGNSKKSWKLKYVIGTPRSPNKPKKSHKGGFSLDLLKVYLNTLISLLLSPPSLDHAALHHRHHLLPGNEAVIIQVVDGEAVISLLIG